MDWLPLAFIALGALTTGCAVTPETRRSLDGYVQAMHEVEQTALVFLSEFANAGARRESLERTAGTATPTPEPEYPPAFVLPAKRDAPRPQAEQAIANTRLALALMREYNDALVALAEGRSEAEIRARAMELGSLLDTAASAVGTVVPGFGQFAAVGAKLLKLAKDAQDREELRAAIALGRAPVLDILTALENQTPAMYDASIPVVKRAQTTLKNEIRRVLPAMRSLIAAHGLPGDPDVAGKTSLMQAELRTLGERTRTLGAMPVPFPYAEGAPALGPDALAQLEVFMQVLRAKGERYAQLVAKQNAYHTALGRYVELLREARTSLERVEASLARPVDLRQGAMRLLRAAFGVRDAIAAFRDPTLAVASP